MTAVYNKIRLPRRVYYDLVIICGIVCGFEYGLAVGEALVAKGGIAAVFGEFVLAVGMAVGVPVDSGVIYLLYHRI